MVALNEKVVLEVKRLSKKFDSSDVLKSVDFTLEEGETLAIIGSSGSGKTTLLRCLNFLERPDAGYISVRGNALFDSEDHNVSKKDIRQNRLHFGLVFQSFNLFPQYTALKNVVLAPELLAKERKDYKANKKSVIEEIRNDGLKLLEQVGLSERRDYYPHQLSGGQQQRVAIARALALKPDILCFDEPTSALDPELTGEVLKVIRSLAATKKSMVIVTHEMQFARDVADKILFMDDGAVIEYGKPEDVFDNPSSDRMKKFLERYNSI
ncbi:MAG: amino acid ABC transporter ATP-binding protein [Clostridiales bacterium]|jgi:polar amino acid transport system ATP-binding protein|nr:amino acid ABC transporter ATP-binding protein [Clostridiales bacterium]